MCQPIWVNGRGMYLLDLEVIYRTWKNNIGTPKHYKSLVYTKTKIKINGILQYIHWSIVFYYINNETKIFSSIQSSTFNIPSTMSQFYQISRNIHYLLYALPCVCNDDTIGGCSQILLILRISQVAFQWILDDVASQTHIWTALWGSEPFVVWMPLAQDEVVMPLHNF